MNVWDDFVESAEDLSSLACQEEEEDKVAAHSKEAWGEKIQKPHAGRTKASGSRSSWATRMLKACPAVASRTCSGPAMLAMAKRQRWQTLGFGVRSPRRFSIPASSTPARDPRLPGTHQGLGRDTKRRLFNLI